MTTASIDKALAKAGIHLPEPPEPVGNYKPYARTGNLIFINQINLQNGRLVQQGVIGQDMDAAEAREAVRQTVINLLSVLKDACEGDLGKVIQCVQLTGFFNTPPGYKGHAMLMDVASDLLVEIFGVRGKHARATVGASSLPEHAPVEIQGIFEIR